jgi:hypothetical protein
MDRVLKSAWYRCIIRYRSSCGIWSSPVRVPTQSLYASKGTAACGGRMCCLGDLETWRQQTLEETSSFSCRGLMKCLRNLGQLAELWYERLVFTGGFSRCSEIRDPSPQVPSLLSASINKNQKYLPDKAMSQHMKFFSRSLSFLAFVLLYSNAVSNLWEVRGKNNSLIN